MRRIVLCADDYALAPGVSRAIRELVGRGRLNAVSVMTVIPDFARECGALVATASPIPIAIGLHTTLTGPFKPLAALPFATGDGNFPPIERYLTPPRFFRVDHRAVKAEVSAQIEAFRRTFGRTPDFVDGHQHVQLLRGVRGPFLEAVAEGAPNAWVRQCGAAAGARVRGIKARLLQLFSRGFRRQAARHGLAFNPAFSGAYDFSTAEDFGALFARFLRAMPERGVVMCHPGFVDQELIARDPLTTRREEEYAFFAGDDFSTALAGAGVSLA
ncbi:MAG TPA: ChbG/HpnK family deacetylase [Xanthobacteraceae bacterium]|nr:ChbG/HpnK family deacetylase [Xanthobacteraceae bacterium]